MKLKRILCALVCACLLAGAGVVPAQAKACNCGEIVQVYMEGFGSTLYYDYGTPEQRKAEMAELDDLAFGIGRLFQGVGLGLWKRSWDPVATGISATVHSIMGHMAMDANGRSILPISDHWRIDPNQNHRERPEFRFHYDFRIDPFEAARQLNEFIEAVIKATGHSKIALTGHSQGAIIVMTYLKQYGAKRLETLIMVNGAWQGLTLVGELLTKQFAISGQSVTDFIANSDDGSGNLKTAMAVLKYSGLLGFLSPMGDFIMDRMGEQIYAETLLPIFGTMPILWAFVPHEYYAEARQLLAADPQYARLLAKADKYQYEVQAQGPKLLKDAMKKGVKVAVIAGYGYSPTPVSKNSTYQCDSLIDTSRAAGGATEAPIGKTLPPNDSKYRSPDGIFDAATCVLPDQTWFIKNSMHESRPSHELRQWIIHSKRQPTIWDNAAFPQYLVKGEDGKAVAQK